LFLYLEMALLKYLMLKRRNTMNTCSECLLDSSGLLVITMFSGSITATNSSVAKVLENQQKQAETKRPHGEYQIYTYYVIRIYTYGVEIFLGKCPTTISSWVTTTVYILCTSASYSCDCLHMFFGSFLKTQKFYMVSKNLFPKCL